MTTKSLTTINVSIDFCGCRGLVLTDPEGVAILAQQLRDCGEVEYAKTVEGATEVYLEITGFTHDDLISSSEDEDAPL